MKLDNLVYAIILGTGTLLGGQALKPQPATASQQQIEKQEEQEVDERISSLKSKIRTQQDDSAEVYYDLHDLYEEKGLEDKAKNTFLEGVEEDMQKPTVDNILSDYLGDTIQKVQYNPRTDSTNFDELVYENDEPSLVLFYTPEEHDSAHHDAVKRGSIVFKGLADEFNEDINFFTYEVSHPETEEGEIEHKEVDEQNIKAPPSIAMYSPYNIVEGKKPKNNDGIVEQIDILRGGPKNNPMIYNLKNFTSTKWIPTNLTDANNNYAWRMNNVVPWNPKKEEY